MSDCRVKMILNYSSVIYITEEPFPIIVLKDMTADGFTIYMQPPENYDDTKKIFKRLAQFHAASYYLTENVRIV